MAAISISRMLAHWAAIQPHHIAVSHEGQSITYAQLEAQSNRLARAYEQLGVRADDFVTIALPNSIEYFVSLFAVWKLGATPQPVSAKLPKFELDQIIEVGKPTLVTGVDPKAHPGIRAVPIGFAADTSLSDAALPERTSTYWKAMTSGGSTGRPKLIVSKQAAMRDPADPFMNFQQQGNVLIPGPLYHNGPFMWATGGLFKGNTVSITTRFDAEQTLRVIEEMKIDTIYLVPTMMHRIWNLPTEIRQKYDLSSLKTLWHLAAPCPIWLKHAFIEWLGPDVIWEIYGGTEGQGSTMITGSEWLQHEGSVGKPTAACEIKIVGEDGHTLPPGVVGEVFMRPIAGPGTTYRYIGAEAKAIEGGWESLGDMGRLDEDGYLYLSDRQTDMILAGGANIYPAEVEAAIDSFPGVRSSCVIGLPDADMGNRVHAIVDVAGKTIDRDALMAHLSERLVRYKIPRDIELVNEPLRDDAGKVRRKTLRDERIKT